MIFLIYLIPIFVYLNRFLIPDYSFDTLNYHIFLGSRGLQNILFPYIKNEFFPTGYQNFPPFLDAVNVFVLNIIGYRLGTIISLLSYVAIIFVTYRIYKKYTSRINKKIEFLDILIITTISDGLFLLATYFIDITLALLLLFSLYLFLNKNKFLSKISILLVGFAVYIKLSNLIYFLPFLLLYYNEFAKTKKSFFITSLYTIFSLIPLLIYCLYNYSLTKNPFYPFYNSLFKSTYALPVSFDFNFGAKTVIQKIFYPIYSFFHPQLLNETGIFFNNFKLNIYYLLNLLFVILIVTKHKKIDKQILKLFIYFFTSYLLWSFLFGYLRYAIFLEVLGGLIFIFLLKEIYKIKYFRIIVYISYVVMIYSSVFSILLNLKYDMSWRPTLLTNSSLHFAQIKNLFIKNIDFKLENVVYVLNCSVPTTGYIGLSNLFRNLPMVNIDVANYPILLNNKNYSDKVNKIVRSKKNTFVTIVTFEGMDANYIKCLNTLSKYNLQVINELPISNFLGYEYTKLKALFIKVKD